jgi:hypothetical protein
MCFNAISLQTAYTLHAVFVPAQSICLYTPLFSTQVKTNMFTQGYRSLPDVTPRRLVDIYGRTYKHAASMFEVE